MTTGARDSHRVIGIDCPSMNWEAAALKKGSSAGKKTNEVIIHAKAAKETLLRSVNSSPLTVWVKETATAAKETLLVTWPSAWHTATGINNFSRFESIG